MTLKHPYETQSHTDANITAVLVICLIGLLLAWIAGVSLPQLYSDVMQSIGSDTAVVQKDGAALPL